MGRNVLLCVITLCCQAGKFSGENLKGWSGFKLLSLQWVCPCPSGDSDSLHDRCSLVPRLFVKTEIRPGCVRLMEPDSHTLASRDHGYMVMFEGLGEEI